MRSADDRHAVHRGAIWTGSTDTDAVLVFDGVVRAIGIQARDLAPADTEIVDLQGGFLMPSFGDGHAHPPPRRPGGGRPGGA